MRRTLGVVVAIAVVTTMTQATAATPVRWAVCGVWRQVPAPYPPPGYGWLNDVAVVSPYEAWAVGAVGGELGYRPVALRWTGREWVVTDVPIRNGTYASLAAVTAVSSTDVWAVGFEGRDSSTHPFAAHWTGSRWRRTPAGVTEGWLRAVAPVPGSRSVWAVGSAGYHSLALRWNGERWRHVASPNPGRYNGLGGAVAFANGTAWAVGTTATGGHDRMLAVRWDGRAWRQVTAPAGGAAGIDGLRPNSMWAGGYVPGRAQGVMHGAIFRWNGVRWSRAFVTRGQALVSDVVIPTPGQGWAVGRRTTDVPLVLRRGSSGWAVSAAPKVSGSFTGVDGTPQNLWATHAYTEGSGQEERYDTYHRC